jgi:DNA-binding transcriptional LysR family regulator
MDDLRLLRVLREVALRGSFSAAAEALSYSQPAVSQQIARLEAQTGVKLIERQPKGIKLTAAGEALVRHTESILSQLQHAQAELTEIASDAHGKLRLGSFSTAAGTIVPRAVKELRRLRPGVQVDLQLIDPPESLPALRRRELDLVIVEEGGFEGELDLAGLGVERLMDDVLYASLPADHPLVTRRAISLTDLCDEDWMLVGLRGTCADSNIVLRACQQAGFEPRVAYTSDDYFAIQGLVASGMGVALVPGLALASTRDDVAVRPLRGRPPYRRIGAVFQPDPVGPVAVMVDCLRDAAEEYKRVAPMTAVATAA